MVKRKTVAWYLTKEDLIVELEVNSSYAVIMAIVTWQGGLCDELMYLGVI